MIVKIDDKIFNKLADLQKSSIEFFAYLNGFRSPLTGVAVIPHGHLDNSKRTMRRKYIRDLTKAGLISQISSSARNGDAFLVNPFLMRCAVDQVIVERHWETKTK